MNLQQPISQLRRAVSDERIEGYRLVPTEDDIELFARYFWNTALAEAFYPLLQALEVTLRNSTNDALSQVIRPDWLTGQPALLQSNEQRMLNEAIAALRSNRRPVTVGRIIAALNFGFWTAILDAR